jgi:hypothetical protein
VVPDKLSRRFGNHEKGELTDRNRFIEVEKVTEDDDNVKKEEEAILMLKAWKVKIYTRVAMYLVYRKAGGLA